MGGMLTWMFGYMYPQFAQALCPIATQPGPMSGRNWIQRRISIEAIKNDPEWNLGSLHQKSLTLCLYGPLWWLDWFKV
jgi:homoserine O-acetyltransferase